MADEHPNISVIGRFNPANLAGSADVLKDDVIWHFFNPRLPEIQGDYMGRDGLQAFFTKIAQATDGTFKVDPISVNAIGNELVVCHSKNTMTLSDQMVETDVVVVFRVVDGRIAEIWDIPSVYKKMEMGEQHSRAVSHKKIIE